MNTAEKIYHLFKQLQPVSKEVPAAYKAYYKSRDISEKKYLCHAPFNNMYFNSLGAVANCWLTFDDPEYYDGTKTIKDIWFGEKFTRLREAIKNYDLQYKCNTCRHYIASGNHVNVLAKAYDNDFPLGDYPTMMEFELSNTCNLECTMCNGLLSSVIRKNRDKLPALKSPYGDRFVEELREFIPHLKEVRFNGGEPFLIHIYYKIWDLIHEIKPELKIVVATNGTTLTPRVKEYMERANFHINISIDSLDPKIYSDIRINGDLSEVLENFKYFKKYCNERNRDLCIMANPMRQNWQGMGNFADFCNEHRVRLWYNTIIRPYNQAIWNLPAAELKTIYDTLSGLKLKTHKLIKTGLYAHNSSVFNNLVYTQIKIWYKEALERESTSVLNSSDDNTASEIFNTNMENFLGLHFKIDIQEASVAKAMLTEKIQIMESHIQGKIPVEEFYLRLNQNNPAAIFIFLLENTPEKIIDNLEKFTLSNSDITR